MLEFGILHIHDKFDLEAKIGLGNTTTYKPLKQRHHLPSPSMCSSNGLKWMYTFFLKQTSMSTKTDVNHLPTHANIRSVDKSSVFSIQWECKSPNFCDVVF